jgi:GntR family transcriptional regulator
MFFELHFQSGVPVYLQLVDQVKAAAASGALEPGDPLPGIRPLAEHLRVNRNTVAKAYAELEAQGIVETIAGKGCFLRRPNTPFKAEVRRARLTEAIDAMLVQAHHLQIDNTEVRRLVGERLEAFDRRRDEAADARPHPGSGPSRSSS